MKVQDHLVSKEVFQLVYQDKLDLYQTQSVPQDLTEYYNSDQYLSHFNAKNSLFEKSYQWIKTYMFRRKRALINSQVSFNDKPLSLLDYGSGSGDFALYMSKHNWKVTTLETNSNARYLIESKGITCYASLNTLPLDKKYDIITLWHVLEHIPNYKEVLDHLKTLLTPNGRIIIAVPNFKSFDAVYYKQYWAGWDVPRHLWHFSRKSLSIISEDQGFVLKTGTPLWFDSFYISILSERYQKKQFSFIRGGIIGLISNLKALKNQEFSSKTYILSINDRS